MEELIISKKEDLDNIADAESKYIHIVGNGTFDAPSNAYTLDWDGSNVETSAILLRSSTHGSTKVFKLTIDDSGQLSINENT